MLTTIFASLYLRAPLPIMGSWIGLDYALNPGIAFGIVLPPLLQYFLITCALVALLWWSRDGPPHVLCRAGVGLILGGGAANIADRFDDGMVTDFIVLWPFPLFNSADVLIALGVLLVLFQKTLAAPLRKW